MTTLERKCLLDSALLHSCYIVARLEGVEKGEVFVKQDGKSFHESPSRLEKGSGDRNRTCDTGLMSPLLYRLSYAALESLVSFGQEHNIILVKRVNTFAKSPKTPLDDYPLI